MKSLYDENYKYNQAANLLNTAAYNALKVLFDTWLKEEYGPREIAHVINGVVMDLELESAAWMERKII